MTIEDEIRDHLFNWEEKDYFEEVTKKEIIGKGRWTYSLMQVIKDTRTSKFYKITWDEGATECQDSSGYSDIVEVVPKEITTTIYVVE